MTTLTACNPQRFQQKLIGIFLVASCFGPHAAGQRVGPLTPSDFRDSRAPYNPKPFQNNLASPSSPVLFMLSERGKSVAGNHPNIGGLLKTWGVSVPQRPASAVRANPSSLQAPGDTGAYNTACNAPAGALFNLEPSQGSPQLGIRAPQNEQSVDFVPSGGLQGADLIIQGSNDYRGVLDSDLNFAGTPVPGTWGLSVTGYYVHRSGSDCGASFEGGLPHMTYPQSGETLFGQGDPVVALDSQRGLVYGADLRFGRTASGIGLSVSSIANLEDSTVCPSGTHLLDGSANDTISSTCWPTRILLSAQPALSNFIDKPHMRVDERASGTGAGDVYLTWSNFDLSQGTSSIQITACRNNPASLADCSTPLSISGTDPQTQFSHIVVRSDGVISITYINVNLVATPYPQIYRQTFDIKYVSCRPNGAPAAPSCSPASLITTELQPMTFGGMLAANYFRVNTYPTHDYRINNGNYEEFVAWSRCKNDPYSIIGSAYPVLFLSCSDADIVMTWSQTDSSGAPLGWASVAPVNDLPTDQLMPWVKTDHSREIVNIAYLSAQKDPFGHRLRVVQNQFRPSAYKPSAPIFVTTRDSEPFDDPVLFGAFIGDYIGIIARGNGVSSRAYIGSTSQFYKGFIYGIPVIDEDNVISAIDY